MLLAKVIVKFSSFSAPVEMLNPNIGKVMMLSPDLPEVVASELNEVSTVSSLEFRIG
jgi:hypothetical protein